MNERFFTTWATSVLAYTHKCYHTFYLKIKYLISHKALFFSFPAGLCHGKLCGDFHSFFVLSFFICNWQDGKSTQYELEQCDIKLQHKLWKKSLYTQKEEIISTSIRWWMYQLRFEPWTDGREENACELTILVCFFLIDAITKATISSLFFFFLERGFH